MHVVTSVIPCRRGFTKPHKSVLNEDDSQTAVDPLLYNIGRELPIACDRNELCI